MEIQSAMKCEKCDTLTIVEIFDRKRKEIRFYPEPRLSEDKIKYHSLRMKRVPSEEGEGKCDAIMLCPVCSDEMRFVGVPLEWNCLDTPGSVGAVPVKHLKPWIISDSREE